MENTYEKVMSILNAMVSIVSKAADSYRRARENIKKATAQTKVKVAFLI